MCLVERMTDSVDCLILQLWSSGFRCMPPFSRPLLPQPAAVDFAVSSSCLTRWMEGLEDGHGLVSYLFVCLVERMPDNVDCSIL